MGSMCFSLIVSTEIVKQINNQVFLDICVKILYSIRKLNYAFTSIL